MYKQSCAEYKRDPSAIAIRRDIFIGSTSQEAKRLKEGYLKKGYRGFPPDALLAGSVTEVAEELQQFKDLGFTDIIIRNMSSDQGESIATIERLSEVKAQLGM